MNTNDFEPTWAEVEPHLDQALELEPARREAWLDELEATQPRIALAVRRLLVRCEAVSIASFLHTPLFTTAGKMAAQLRSILEWHYNTAGKCSSAAIPDAWQDLAAGYTVGPYQLIRNIGNGGMSSVWLAARCDGQLKRQVALKLPFVDSSLRLEHFVRERDVLAALTHPQIARLYDAGISAAGQPYLAMEYVEGSALLRSCQDQQLGVRERLQIFLQVLEAVQFAHAALIIHRDLKPSNILVTPQGRVVLLDFGISKLLTEPNTQATQLGRALTPDYASPEQISGRWLGTASDIYSLGVILYELLTGLRPYRPRRASNAALEEAILDAELQPPSVRVVAARMASAGSRRTLARTLAGDIDTIVLKALKKNPLERYASVSALAQDISNYLQGLPVSARPDSFWYRCGRFITRHKVPVVVACIAVLVLLGGSLLFHQQARQAAADRDRTSALASRNAAVTEFLGRLMKDAPQSPRPITVTELLSRAEQMALRDSGDLPENRAAVLEMIADRYWSLSDTQRAGKLMAKAVALLENTPDQALRSRYLCKLAVITTDLENAPRAIQAIMREVDAPGTDPEAAAECLLHRTILDGHLNHAEDMLRQTQRGLQLLAGSRQHSSLLEAKLLSKLAFATHLNGRGFEAQRYFEQAMHSYTAMGRERSEDALNTLNDWAVMITQIAPRHAVQLFERVEHIQLARESDATENPELAVNKAFALQLVGQFAAAQAAYEAQCHSASESRLRCLHGLAAVMLDLEQPERAAEYLAQAAQLMGTQRAVSPPRVAQALLQGRLDLLLGRLTQAQARFDWILRKRGPSSDLWRRKSEIELAAARPAAAVMHAQRALQMSQTQQQGFPHSRQTGLGWLSLGRALQALGEHDRARAAFAAGVEDLASTVDAEHPRLLEARRLLGSGVTVQRSPDHSAVGATTSCAAYGAIRGARCGGKQQRPTPFAAQVR